MLKNIFDNLLKILFNFKDTVIIKNFEFDISIVEKGKIFRTGCTVWHPTCPGPYNENNWYSKYCAIVLFRIKVLSFSVYNQR